MHALRPRSHTSMKRLAVGTLLVSVASGLAGCGGDSKADGGSQGRSAGGAVEIAEVGTVEVDAELAELLPADVAEDEKVTVATNAPYAPFIDFVEEGNTEDFTGLDHDLVTAIAAKLGIVADSVYFMDDGVVVESCSPAEVLENPRHQRTQAFLSKVL